MNQRKMEFSHFVLRCQGFCGTDKMVAGGCDQCRGTHRQALERVLERTGIRGFDDRAIIARLLHVRHGAAVDTVTKTTFR